MATKQRNLILALIILLILLSLVYILWFSPYHHAQNLTFNGNRAKAWVDQQCALGYRITGSKVSLQATQMIMDELEELGWQVRTQDFSYMNTPGRNLIAWQGTGQAVLIGAHYDTRRQADAEGSSAPVLGANDGASGVAILLELARILDIKQTGKLIYLAFFDAEDNGYLDGWEWIAGSSYMAEHWGEHGELPLQYAVIVDMVGDKDLNIYWDRNSDRNLSQSIWKTAQTLGYHDNFIPQIKYTVYDDHIPFIEMGVPGVDIIDFDYSYWHTTRDTPDKVSAASLEVVGRTLESWLESQD